MRRIPTAEVASIGVTQTKLAVEDELTWLFREQSTEDRGIDAQIEVVDGEDARGRLLALQIKSGESWFQPAATGGSWPPGRRPTCQILAEPQLPVAVVLCHPGTKRCHWQLMNRRTLQETPTFDWKPLVPQGQVLDVSAAGSLREAAEGELYVLPIRRLPLARPWIGMLASSKRLVVDIEEWISKKLRRGHISVGVDNEDDESQRSWRVGACSSDSRATRRRSPDVRMGGFAST
ncbi:DUF4365 domain-containing protein [Micromonospora sp. DT53]|uniref:DUF4365 domain-containing protein n=1 Tax=Micromonospora sp. DT53 TaxID=3393444 RepID=UPI003CE7910E